MSDNSADAGTGVSAGRVGRAKQSDMNDRDPDIARHEGTTMRRRIFVHNRFIRPDSGLPDGQGTNIRVGLDKAREGWREPARRNRLRPADQPAMLQLVKDVYEVTTREAAQQQPVVIPIRDGQRWGSIASTLAVVGAWAGN
jgi:hypothetical protein